MHLRNKQRREWDAIKKKMQMAEVERKEEVSRKEKMLDHDKMDEDRIELQETAASKQLTTAMVKSARGNSDETLQKAVEVLQNQNGNNP